MLSNVIFMLGRSLVLLSFGMIIATGAALVDYDEQWVSAFLFSSVITLAVGGGMNLASRGLIVRDQERRDAIAFGVLFWVFCSVFAALPIYFGGATSGFVPALFEAMSGITTTGATILSDLEGQNDGLILWRALLQWYGGIATVIFAVSLLSNLGIDGIGASQSHLPRGDEHNIYRRLVRATVAVVPVYLVMTVVAFISMITTGVTPFEALVHAMTAMSTGGFSTRDYGLIAFDNPWFSAVVLFWCFMGAINFTLHWALYHGRRGVMDWDSETRMLFKVTVAAGFVLVGMTLLSGESLTLSNFFGSFALAVSAVTTSGFVVGETFTLPVAGMLFVAFLMLIGPSTGSTAGGFKLIKAQLLFRLVRRELIRLPNPRSVRLVQYAGARVDDDFMRAIWVMFGLFIFAVVLGTIGLAATGLPLDLALSATITSLANAGGFYGIILGDLGAHGDLSQVALGVLTVIMMIGRLELLAVLAMFSRAFWRS